MTQSKTKAAAAPETSAPTMTAEAIQATLYDERADAKDHAAARKAFDAIATAGRPWEQLPARLKGAARADARRVLDRSGDIADLTSAGYSTQTAARLMRDIGFN